MWCLLDKNTYFCSMLQFENQKIKQIVRKVLPVVTLGAMLYSCASIGRPDGGPYDETPPRFIGSTPAAGALNNERTKISLMFDEFIKLEKATEKVVVSPPQIQQPEIKASGKRIQVNLLDSLKPNTTYTIDFSDAIVDNNEGNPLGNFAFTFSTGTEIDTMEVAGTMLDASNLEPIKGMLVGLHSNLNDSAFNKLPFDRVARTDSRGRFSIRGVAPGKYRIYGLMDAVNCIYADIDNRFRYQIARNHLQSFLLDVYDKCYRFFPRQEIEGGGDRQRQLFEKFIAMVHENCLTEREVTFYADKLCISTKYLTGICKNVTGDSAKKIIDNFSMLEIKVMLQGTELNIQEIADRMQFPDQSYLGRYFKRLEGISPIEYRNLHKS